MEAIRYYVKGAFLGIAETPDVLEQQDELIADLTAKVADLVADGKTQDEALGIAIASTGDLSGLVREFAAEEEGAVGAKPVPTVEAYTTKLQLHAVVISAGAAIAVLFVISLFAAVTDNLRSSAGLWGLFFGGAALLWIGYVLFRFHERPGETGVVELSWKPFRRAVLQWLGACAVALFLNLLLGQWEFWAWTIWIAAVAWPASIYVEQWLLRNGKFLYVEAPEGEPHAAEVATSGSPA